MHARFVRERGQRTVGIQPPDVDRGGVVDRVGGEHHAGTVDGGHRPHLQVWRGHRLAVDEESACAVTVGARDERAVGLLSGHAGDDLDPDVVAILEQRCRRAGRGVDAEHVERGLIPRLHRGEQAGFAPLHVGEVGERLAVPLDVDDGAVEADHVQRDVGVRRSRRRVGELAGRLAGIGGISEVPALHGRRVDTTDRQRGAVGAPPVAAEAVHLLGGDEVGAAPRDRLRLVVVAAGEDSPAPVELGDAEQPTAHVGDALGERVGPGIEHRAGDGELACRAGDEPADEQPPADGEGGDGDVAVGGEGGDATGRLPRPLAAGALLGREVVVAPGEEQVGIGDQALLTGRGVDHPQAVDRVGAATAAQEDDPLAVGRHDDVAWLAECEALGPCRLARKGVGLLAHRAANRRRGISRRRRG